MFTEVNEKCTFCGFTHPVSKIPGMTVPYEPARCVEVLGHQVMLLTTAIGAILGGMQGIKSKFFCPWCRSMFDTPQELVEHVTTNPGK